MGFRIVLSVGDRAELERYQRTTTKPAGEVRRARAILLLADGETLQYTAELVGLGRRIVRKWAWRFLEEGLPGLRDRPGRGRKPSFPP